MQRHLDSSFFFTLSKLSNITLTIVLPKTKDGRLNLSWQQEREFHGALFEPIACFLALFVWEISKISKINAIYRLCDYKLFRYNYIDII